MNELEKKLCKLFFYWVDLVLPLKLQQPIIASIKKLCWYYLRFAKDVLY